MSNITKIKISGTSYNIKDENACNVVELTQAQYDALPATAKTSNSLFVITDSQGADLSQYWTSAQTESAITQAVSGKQDTLSAGTGIDITDNVISATGGGGGITSGEVQTMIDESISGKVDTSSVVTAVTSASTDSEVPTAKAVYDAVGQGGGGGKAIEAGTNISVTTGETADTINCTLPISADTNGIYTTSSYPFEGYSSKSKNVVFGNNNKINKNGSSSFISCNFMTGRDNKIADGEYLAVNMFSHFISGENNKIEPSAYQASAVFGASNIAKNSCEFDSGLYNVSNTGNTASANTLFSVGNGTADNARHNAFEIRQNGDIYCSDGTNDVKLQDTITATVANTTALGGLKLVKLTQSEYDALQNKDENTLYVVVSAATPTPSWVSYGVGDEVLAGSYSNLRIPSAVTFDDENSHFDIQLSNGDIAHIGAYCTETMCQEWDCAEYDEETGDCIEQGDSCLSEYCSIVDEGYCINSSYAFDKDVDSLTHFTFGQDGYWYLNEGFTVEVTGDILPQFVIEVLPNSI